jgi:sugar lactone lactonase YvrE
VYRRDPSGNVTPLTAPNGSFMLGKISVPSSENIQVTNVAFRGSDHKTLCITGLQNNKGLFQVKLDIPGRPY